MSAALHDAAREVRAAREHEACGFWGLNQDKRRASRAYRERVAATVAEQKMAADRRWLAAIAALLGAL